MKKKLYDIESDPTPMLADSSVGYAYAPVSRPVPPLSVGKFPQAVDDRSAWLDANYDRLLAEANQKYGDEERMTPEEYFGKLWYIVEKGYEAL